jgi:hypothetical protein
MERCAHAPDHACPVIEPDPLIEPEVELMYPSWSSMYRLMGRIHAGLALPGGQRGQAGQRGQGTVEYVALILLVALVMAGVVAAMKGFRTEEGKELGDVIIAKIKEAVRKVQF